jgi:2-amino-4-hydroxy-6-hydroxymethyldihydropteridine diphosphokinase
MPRVYLSLGSNIDRERHLRAAYVALRAAYGELVLSSVYESEAVGFDGDHFLNLVIGIDSSLSVGTLAAQLRAIEEANGRSRIGPKFSARTLDIDILTYGDASGIVDGVQLPRDEVLKNAFVLQPLAEVAGAERHPVTGLTYAEHWESYDKSRQQLWIIPFSWQ